MPAKSKVTKTKKEPRWPKSPVFTGYSFPCRPHAHSKESLSSGRVEKHHKLRQSRRTQQCFAVSGTIGEGIRLALAEHSYVSRAGNQKKQRGTPNADPENEAA
jgi:hypothetical protein